jgi:tRNA synthetases class I (K)
MTTRQDGSSALLPYVVATGFTTAFLGDERTLREFVVGDHVVRALREQGLNAVLYLINDTYDPLDERQLRVGVEKDAALIRKFRQFCGRPIAEIPDPYDCHGSYSDHFAAAWIERLGRLDIHPLVIDAHRAYRAGHYDPFLAVTFERYHEIQGAMSERFGYAIQNLVRVQCPGCHCLDATSITGVGDHVEYRCARCGVDAAAPPASLRGKLNWKLDCAARWNLYGIDREVFGKAHLALQGTRNVSHLVSSEFFGGRVPAVVPYGELKVQRELSGRLIEILPPNALKRLLTEHLGRDLDLSLDSVAQFAERFEVKPGTNYAEFVRRELPRLALETEWSEARTPRANGSGSIHALVDHANAYSELYHGRRHGIRWPGALVLSDVDAPTIRAARDAVAYALALRQDRSVGVSEVKARLKSYMAGLPSCPALYPFLRRLFGQDHGPNITTLLAILPPEYLATLMVITEYAAVAAGAREGSSSHADARGKKAA